MRKLTEPGRKKSLYFGGNSVLPGRLESIPPEEISSRKLAEFPAVAALCYAVVYLVANEPKEDQMWQFAVLRAEQQQYRGQGSGVGGY